MRTISHRRERKSPSRDGQERPQRRGSRRLVIRGETWTWRFGHVIDIRDAEGKGHKADLAEVLGGDREDVERASWKRNLTVDPSLIVDHINRRILGYDDAMGFPAGSRWHRHQAAMRDGWIAFAGPRGIWQARITPWLCDIRSPEDVGSVARIYEMLEITIDEWTDIKVADMAAEGLTVDDLWRIEQAKPNGGRARIETFLGHPSPSVPTPTSRQLEDHVVRHIVGRAARAMA